MNLTIHSRLKTILAAALVAAVAVAHGASVRYGDAAYLEPKLSLYDATPVGGGDFWLFVHISNLDKFSIEEGLFFEDNYKYLIKSVEANRGDLADAEYFASRTDFFTKDFVEGNGARRYGYEQYRIFLEPGESVYLAYNITDNALGELYGWVQLAREGDNNLAVLGSAIDLAGGSLVVGVIPEPSSGLLFMLGLSVLSLARPRHLQTATG